MITTSGIYIQDDKFGCQYYQDNRSILEHNHQQRQNSDENWQNADADLKPAGRIPRLVWLLWEQMGITRNSTDLLKALERNPEWKTTTKQLA